MTLAADPHAMDEAATLLAEADALATAQDVPMLGLRIAVTAARLDSRRGEGRAAAEQLRKALARITEDDDGPDLIAARALTQGVLVA
jgi:hypothetical protein